MGHDGPPGEARLEPALSEPPANRVDLGWLSLRGPADVATRTKFTARQVAELDADLRRRSRARSGPVRLVDVGAGTGAGAQWLRARLSVDQEWLLVDHDRRVLDAAVPCAEGWARGVVATVADLDELVAAEPVDVVTCQALLDVLTGVEVDSLLNAASACGAAVLLSLSVTGEVSISPPHPDDSRIGNAFDAHQRRGGRLGPDAPAYAAAGLRRLGYTVTSTDTPWELDEADVALVRAWLHGRAEAALEQSPGSAAEVTTWRLDRDDAVTRGELSAVVGHVDLLAFPPQE